MNKTLGLEFMANYRSRKFTADLNFTWTHTFASNILIQNIDDNNNTPTIMSNAIVSWQATPHLRLHSHILFEGTQRTYNYDLVKLIKFSENLEMIDIDNIGVEALAEAIDKLMQDLIMKKEMSSRIIFNIGAEYQIGKLTLGANIRNLFDKYYYRSGMNTNVVPQKGRWFMFDVAYKF